MIINVKSKSQIISEIIKYIRSRFPLADVVPNTVLRDMNVESPANYFYDTYKVVAFLEQALDLAALQALLENSDERANLAVSLGVSIETVEEMVTDIVELWASNYGLVRKEGLKATGFIAFYPKPGTTIPPSGTAIPAGARTTIPNTNLVFRTREDGLLEQASSSFNTVTNQYEAVVAAEAELVGTAGNVPANTITQLYAGQTLDALPINYNNFSGGVNRETDIELLNRVRLVYTGNFHGTANSIVARALAYPFVQDAKVAYLPGDPSKISSGISDIDLFVKSQASALKTYGAAYNPLYNNSVLLPDNYVAYVNSFKILDNGYIFQPQVYEALTNNDGQSFVHLLTDFSTQDSTLSYAGNDGTFNFYKIPLPGVAGSYVTIPEGTSANGVPISTPSGRVTVQRKTVSVLTGDITYADDTLNWYFTADATKIKRLISAAIPNYVDYYIVSLRPESGDSIEINYVYNETIQTLADDLNNPANLFLGQNIHVFQAEQVPITVRVTVQISPSYGLTEKTTECENAIADFLTGLSLGATINQIDIVDVMLAVAGVVDVKIPLGELSTPLEPGTADIELTSKQFAGVGTIEVTTQYAAVVNQ